MVVVKNMMPVFLHPLPVSHRVENVDMDICYDNKMLCEVDAI